MVTVQEAAVCYREAGYSVIPVRGDKKPHYEALRAVHGNTRWASFRSFPASPKEIRQWYEVAPDAGVAILTGCPEFGNLTVADFDRGHRPKRLYGTPTVQTGSGGLHVYLRGSLPTNRTPWGDLQSEGAYVVAPPSPHASGGSYQWKIALPDFGNVFLPESDPLDVGSLARFTGATASAQRTRTRAASVVQPEFSEIDALRALAVIGVKHRGVESLHCPLHDDRRPSAGLVRNDDGYWIFHCQVCRVSYRLATLYAETRGADRTGKGTILLWAHRLEYEMGLVSLPPLRLERPPTRSANVPKLIDGLELFLRIEASIQRLSPCELSGQPFASSFASPWCGITHTNFIRARGEVLRSEWLVKTGQTCFAGSGRLTGLFLPAQLNERGSTRTRRTQP